MKAPQLGFNCSLLEGGRRLLIVIVESLSHVWLFVLHVLEHSRLPCPPLSPEICLDSCPLSQWCYLNLIFCHCLLRLPSIFPSIRVFSNESTLHIKWPKYWSISFRVSTSSEYSGLISFRIDWFDSLAVQWLYFSSFPLYSLFNILYSISITFWSFTSFSLLSWIEGNRIEEKLNK